MPECPVVEISLGKVKGRALPKVKDGKEVFLYTRLPFAKPPVGELRFEPPVDPAPWNGVLDASEHSAAPLQDSKGIEVLGQKFPTIVERIAKDFSEDCLYLSVYTSNPSKAANLPVMFSIYGGGFAMGGEVYYDASVFASLFEVVVVAPNYRVNAFGFLSLGQDTDYPGNAGMMDQIMALKWTRDHIRAFGGNPDNVTISGESAGAMSVNYHVVSPMSKGLFHRAISHSGSIFFPGFPLPSTPAQVLALAEELKLDEKDSLKIVKKLKTVPPEDIMKAVKALAEVAELRKESVASNVPYIMGVNNTEGAGLLVLQYPKDFDQGISEEVCTESLKGIIGGMLLPGLPESAYETIKEEYLKKKPDDDKMKWSKVYADVTADLMFVKPVIESAEHLLKSKGNPSVYMYWMTQQLKYNHDPAYGPESARKVAFCECDHGDDTVFTYGLPLMDRKLTFDAKFTDDEKTLSIEWIKYVANFAKNGDPNVGAPVRTTWPPYNLKDREYLSVQYPFSTGKALGGNVSKFWEKVILPMRKDPFVKAQTQF